MINYRQKLNQLIFSTPKKKMTRSKKHAELCKKGKHRWERVAGSDYKCSRPGCKQHKFDMGYGAYLYIKKEPFSHKEHDALEQLKGIAAH